jgi:hypothetical protein
MSEEITRRVIYANDLQVKMISLDTTSLLAEMVPVGRSNECTLITTFSVHPQMHPNLAGNWV